MDMEVKYEDFKPQIVAILRPFFHEIAHVIKSEKYTEILCKDEMYFGAGTNLDDRLDLLRNAERDKLGPFVQRKMEQEKEQKLDVHGMLDERNHK
ncbi:hypothetical protein ACO22_01271 [Paracoccidioides brasiliensis]|uniref:Uncharacterized protein n=1 Tax=Paracoccidioides brasiliensis TaxID=121759 RepID=A0A1D2JLW0_PARBR|nr:hypothetical protein ACO22_01271 [Paracoccidioides brasiliensis]